MKRLAIVISIGLLVAAGACGAWWITSRVSTREWAYQRDFPRGNCFTGSILQKRARRDEAQLLAAHADVARRDGDSLLISFPGRPQIRLTDDVPNCNSSILSGIVTLRDEHTGQATRGVVVTMHMGEFDDQTLYLADGRRLFAGRILLSPGADHIAMLSNLGVGVIDWPDLDHMALLRPECDDAFEWRDDTHFTANCTFYVNDDRQPDFTAAGWREKDEVWHIRATAWQDPSVKSPLPSFTAKPFDRKAADQAGQSPVPQ